MRLALFLFIFLMLFACQETRQSSKSTHPELVEREIPDGYKKFIAFNNGYEIFFPEDWKLHEKAKHEYTNIVGPKSQSSVEVRPTINVTMRRGKTRFKEGADPVFLPFEFEKYSTEYLKGVRSRMNSFSEIETKEATINQSKTKSMRFTYMDIDKDVLIYKEVIQIALPYRMYIVNLSCLNDELFRNEDHFEVVKNSFLGKARADGAF